MKTAILSPINHNTLLPEHCSGYRYSKVKRLLILGVLLVTAAQTFAESGKELAVLPTRPVIIKKGTIDLDLCETTPFVFKGKVYRMEWHRPKDFINGTGKIRIMDRNTQTEVSHFGSKHRFPCAFVEGDTVYVIGTTEDHGWCGSTLTLFTSKDLINWNEQVAYHNPEFRLCNTSICKAGDRYVMSIELVVGGGYIGRFLESKDLIHWTLTPPECGIGCTSVHLLRWHNGWFYVFTTAAGHAKGHVLSLYRSRDLKSWEATPFNPVMSASEEDKLALNPRLTEAERAAIAKNGNSNNSDIDFCEFGGKLVINYCWGTQGGPGHEYIAEAEFAGTMAQFLTGWFPDAWTGIDLSQPPSTFLRHRADYGRVLSATGATVTISSGNTNALAQLLSGSCPSGFAFHTGNEANPWVTIDLGREASITGVLVRNRTDCCQERAENLRLQVSSDNQNWKEVWKAASIEPRWEIPLLGQDVKARYLRLDARPATPTPFHLQHVEVWGKD